MNRDAISNELSALPSDAQVKARLLEMVRDGIVTARLNGAGSIIYSSTADMPPALLSQALSPEQVQSIRASRGQSSGIKPQ